jgi:predicted small lipoprotein YifL
MKYIFTLIVLVIVFSGCGHKADPVYLNDTKVEIKDKR